MLRSNHNQVDSHVFQRGDKVVHIIDKEDGEEMIGNVLSRLDNGNYLVEFWLPGRKRQGYRTVIEFSADEIMPCCIPEENYNESA